MGFIPHRSQTGMGIEGMGIGTEFLTHGLPMLNPTKLSPNFICTYITGEQAVGCYSKGFTPEELEQPIGPFCTSSLGLVPKPNSDVLQMIQDMLFPHDHQSMCSINHGINPNDFPTAWGTFDATSSLILTLPTGCVAATFNISAAYCLTPIWPDQQQNLCIM